MVGGVSPGHGPVGVSAMPCPGSAKADAVRSGFHEISGYAPGSMPRRRLEKAC